MAMRCACRLADLGALWQTAIADELVDTKSIDEIIEFQSFLSPYGLRLSKFAQHGHVALALIIRLLASRRHRTSAHVFMLRVERWV